MELIAFFMSSAYYFQSYNLPISHQYRLGHYTRFSPFTLDPRAKQVILEISSVSTELNGTNLKEIIVLNQ